MTLPTHLTLNSGRINLTLLQKEDIPWILNNTSNILMSNVFGKPEKGQTDEDFYTQQLSWTNVYLICDEIDRTYGMIRVVPELDDYFSVHGIGWPNNYKFSRIYFEAWIGIHEYLFSTQIYLRSNCSQKNIQAINVLSCTGYEPLFINSQLNEEQNINFSLDNTSFRDSRLYKSHGPVLFEESTKIKKREYAEIRHLSATKFFVRNKSVHYHLLEHYQFENLFIQNRISINVPKEVYELKYKKNSVFILILHFKQFKHYHMEFPRFINFQDLMKIKLKMKIRINAQIRDTVFTYYSDINKKYIMLLMANDFIYMGEDEHRKTIVWSFYS